MNKNYEAFRNNIIYAVRSSGLELGSIYYILKDIMSEVERDYSNVIQQELEAERQMQMEIEAEQRAKEEAASVGPDDEDVSIGL